MPIVIVPNVLADAINKRLDDAFLLCPEAVKDRDHLYHQLLEYFDEHGIIPEFEIKKKDQG